MTRGLNSSAEPACEIIFIRHGQTDWNKTQRLQGRKDIELNDLGRGQVRTTARKLAQIIKETPDLLEVAESSLPLGISDIYSSPLKRASESAEILAEELQWPLGKRPLILVDDLQEWNAGKLEGCLLSEIPAKFPDEWNAWHVKRDVDFVFEGGESFRDRYERVVTAVERLAQNALGKRLLISIHGGVLDDVYRKALGLPISCFTKVAKLNAGVHIIHVRRTEEGSLRWSLRRWGDTIPSREGKAESTSSNLDFDTSYIEYV